MLLEFFSWSSFFGLNVTLAVAALAGTLAVIPSSRDEAAPRMDPVGSLLALVGIVGTVFSIIEGPERGWSEPLTVTGFLVGALGLAGFVLWELRRTDPMLDPRLFRLRGFSAGSIALTIQFFGSFGFFFVIMQYLQYIQGRSPLMAAVCLLPLPMVLIPLARRAPVVAARLGTHRVVSLGLVLSAAGMLLLSRLSIDTPYWYLATGMVVFAAGMGLAGTPATTAIVSSLPESQQGVASAVNDTSRELGSVLGIAILGSALNAAYRDGLSPTTDAAAAAGRGRGGVLDRLHHPGCGPARSHGPGRRPVGAGRPAVLRRRDGDRLPHRLGRAAARCGRGVVPRPPRRRPAPEETAVEAAVEVEVEADELARV